MDVAVTGHNQQNADTLARSVANLARLDQLDHLASELVEFDTLLFAREGDRTRVYAPVFQTRSIFWTRVAGTAILSDEQYPLATLNGLEVDLGVLTARITNAEVTHPFVQRPIWLGVEGLGLGESVTVQDAGGESKRETWWSPPSAELSVSDLALDMSKGIADACRLRLHNRDAVSSDLSGGLDSTSLCFNLAEFNVNISTFFMGVKNELNNDWKWSGRAAKEIGSNHIALPYSEMLQDIVAGVPATVTTFPEGPTPLSTAIASAEPLERILRETGSRLHFNGHAGDALFARVSSSPWSFARSAAKQKLKWLWQYRTLNRIPTAAIIRMLSDGRSFSSELHDLTQGKFRNPVHDQVEYASWIQAPKFSKALRPAAMDQFSEFAEKELVGHAEPLSPDRTLHQILSYLLTHGAVVRRMNVLSGEMQFDSPYLDRRIVEPALALNHDERTRQRPVKPLLAASRPSSMSIEYFERQDKGDYTAEVFDQHAATLARTRRLFSEGSKLSELGLVDDGEVVRMATAYSVDGASYSDVVDLEFAERWIRSIDRTSSDQVWRPENSDKS